MLDSVTNEEPKSKRYRCMCGAPYGAAGCDWTGPAEDMVVVAIVEESERGSFRAAFRATAKERGFRDLTRMSRYSLARNCAELMVADRDEDGKENPEHQWACIVPGDPTQHAYQLDEHGDAIE